MKVRAAATFVLALFAGCGGNTDDGDARQTTGAGTGGVGVSGSAGTTVDASQSAGTSGSAGVPTGGTAPDDASQSGGTSGTAARGGGGAVDTGGAGSGGSTDSDAGPDGDAGTPDGGRDICDLPPETGVCLAIVRRFYFDADTAQCHEFEWGGCGGNANNFESREACEAACAHRADSCRPEGECRACPLTSDANGKLCLYFGLECTFGPRCGGVVCVCSGANPRAGVWRCTTPPC